MIWPLPVSQSHFTLPLLTTFILVTLPDALRTSAVDLFSAGKIPLLAPDAYVTLMTYLRQLLALGSVPYCPILEVKLWMCCSSSGTLVILC